MGGAQPDGGEFRDSGEVVSEMDATEKQRVMEQARANVADWRAPRPEVVHKRNPQPTLIHKITEDARVDQVAPVQSMDTQQDWADSWNDWLARGIEAAILKEREFSHEVVGDVIGQIREGLREEFAKRMDTEARVLSAEIRALRDEVACLRTQLAQQSAITGAYKQIGDQAVQLYALGTQLATVSKSVAKIRGGEFD
jgi:hypothetical protein